MCACVYTYEKLQLMRLRIEGLVAIQQVKIYYVFFWDGRALQYSTVKS